MVVKRQCSFCAGEIEPGTGLMFVKRDGTIFHFCSGSCRRQQLHLGRVGHRVRWTRAHALKREQATAQAHASRTEAPAGQGTARGARRSRASGGTPSPEPGAKAPAPSAEGPTPPAGTRGKAAAAPEGAAPAKSREAAETGATKVDSAPPSSDPAALASAEKKPRPRKPKSK
jgi:large subunit ribosomal protein L24e